MSFSPGPEDAAYPWRAALPSMGRSAIAPAFGETIAMKRCEIAAKVALSLGTVVLCASSAMAARDNFNRSRLGRNWVVTSGSLYTTNEQLQGTSGALGYDTKSAGDMAATVTVYLNGTDIQYGAVALGDIGGGNNAFIKIQSQDSDGQFEYGAFYLGNNGEGEFFPLKEMASSPATITAWFCGTYGFV